MNQLLADSLTLLRKMVAQPSVSGCEGTVCSLILDAMKDWGIDCKRIENNIVARCDTFDASLPTLALDAHIDTVPAAASYSRNPADPGDDADRIWGLGSNDDGGSVVAMIAVLRHFKSEKLPFNLVLTLCSDEEKLSAYEPAGARLLYRKGGVMDELDTRWVIIGEPTGMKAASSERGLLVLDGEATGKSGHAARDEGENALYKALDDIQKLRSYDFSRISPLMGKVKLSVTQISAGTAHNVIPDRCRFVVDIRPTEVYTPAEILELLQAEVDSTLTARRLTNHSSATPADSPLLKAAARCGLETFSSPTTSDWLAVRCDALKMGPGDSARSHHADEYILCSEIEHAVRTYIDFINNFYGNIVE